MLCFKKDFSPWTDIDKLLCEYKATCMCYVYIWPYKTQLFNQVDYIQNSTIYIAAAGNSLQSLSISWEDFTETNIAGYMLQLNWTDLTNDDRHLHCQNMSGTSKLQILFSSLTHFISICRQAENKCTCRSEKTSPNHTLLVPRNPTNIVVYPDSFEWFIFVIFIFYC